LKNIIEKIKGSDGIIWCFPVYTTLILAQLKRFIELLFEKGRDNLKDKYAISLSTSMKFFDITAHNYIQAISEDLGMKFEGFYSAQSYDFLDFNQRKKWYFFLEHFLKITENKELITQRYFLYQNHKLVYSPEDIPEDRKLDNPGKKIIVITDNTDEESNIFKMINRFMNSFKNSIFLYDLNDIDIKGGCLGCLRCGLDNKCIYNDEFIEFFQKVKNADILVYAGTLKDRFLSSRWKLYFDRSFFNGHTPSMEGSQLCYLISGPLKNNENVRQWMRAIADLGFANLIDIVTDEYDSSEIIDNFITNMARKALKFAKTSYIPPSTFYKVGGYKIFRDMLYGLPGAIFRRDFEFFSERKMFDFPTKDLKGRLYRKLLSFLLKSKHIRDKFKPEINSNIIHPFNQKLEELDYEAERIRISKNL